MPDGSLLSTFEVRSRVHPMPTGELRLDTMAVGASITDILDRLEIPRSDRDFVVVGLNDTFPDRGNWHRIRPKAGVTVFVKAVPGIEGAALLIGALAGSAATATGASAAIAAGLGAAGITVSAATVSAVIGTLVTAIATFALTAAFSPSGSSLTRPREDTRARQSISGSRNQAIPFEAVPVTLGTHRVIPPYGARPFTELVGNAQFLRLLVVWGVGPVDVQNIRIGNTPIENFDDVELEHDFVGTTDTLTLYPGQVFQEDLAARLSTDFDTRTTEIDVDEISIDITFPNGLSRFLRNTLVTNTITIISEYRLVGDVDFTEWLRESVTSRTGRVLRRTFRLPSLTRGQYEIRVRRADDESTASTFRDRADWTALRSIRSEDPVKAPNIARTALRIRATNQSNGIIDQLNADVSTLVKTWDGSAWSGSVASSNPAAVFRYVLTSTSNKRALPDARIDDQGLGEWYDYCVTVGANYDGVIDTRRSVRELLQDIAAAGYASPRLRDGKWGVVVDRPQTTITQLFTPRNTRNFEGRIVYLDKPHAYRVRFLNAEIDYLEDEVIVYDEGFDESNATDFEVLEAPGKTDPEDIYRWARHIMATARLRPEIFTFDTDVEHLMCERGDLVEFTHDVPRIGLATGRVKAVSGNDVQVDELLTFEDGKSYTLRVRLAGGSMVSRSITSTSAGSFTTITLDDATGIQKGDQFAFGEVGSERETLIVKEIEMIEDLGARITGLPYRDAVYTAVDEIPEFVSVVSTPTSLSFIGPPRPVITHLVSDELALLRTATGDLVPSILVYVLAGQNLTPGNLAETTTETFEISWRENSTDDLFKVEELVPADVDFVRITGVELGIGYDIRCTAIGPNGERSQRAEVLNHVVLGSTAPPTEVTTFGVNVSGGTAHLEWTYDTPPIDVVSFEIRYSPNPDVTDWFSMVVLEDAIPASARSFAVVARPGSYGIKPIDINGTASKVALFVNSTITAAPDTLNVATITEHPDFLGTRDGTGIDGAVLTLVSDFPISDWGVISDIGSIVTGGADVETTGTYEFGETDLGRVYTVTATPSMVVSASSSDNAISDWGAISDIGVITEGVSQELVTVRIEIARSTVDSATPVYGAWQRFAVGQYVGRHFKFRVVMSTEDDGVLPEVLSLSVALDVSAQVLSDKDVLSSAGPTAVTFSRPFREAPSVTLAAQDLLTGEIAEITNKTATGFSVEFKGSSDVSVSRTFDWQAVGHG